MKYSHARVCLAHDPDLSSQIITITLFLSDNNGVYVITDMLGHLTGIYPTAIIVLVCLNMTFHDGITRTETTLTSLHVDTGRSSDTRPSNHRSFGAVVHLRKDAGTGTMATSSSETDGGLELGLRSDHGSGNKTIKLGRYDHDRWLESESSGVVATADSSAKAGSWV